MNISHLKKSLIASFFTLFAFVGMSAVVDAQQVSLTPSGRISNYTNNPNTNTAWSTTGITANPGDVIAVEVGYLVNGSVAAQELRVRITPRSRNASSIQYQLCIDARNADDVCLPNPITLNIVDGPQEVAFNGAVFVYEYSAGAPGNAALVANTISPNQGLHPALHNQLVANRERIFQSDGMRIGDINPGQQSQGSLTAHFQIQNEPVGPTYNPSVNISANPALIAAGQQGQINWQLNDVNLNTCQATMISGGNLADWGGNSTPNFSNSGSTFIGNMQSGTQYTFRLSCQGLDGSNQNDTVSITVQQDNSNPVITIEGSSSDSSTTIEEDESITIDWSWSDADNCRFLSSPDVSAWNIQNTNGSYNSSTESGSVYLSASALNADNDPYRFTIDCDDSPSVDFTVYVNEDDITPSGGSITVETEQELNNSENGVTLRGSVTGSSTFNSIYFALDRDASDADCQSGVFSSSDADRLYFGASLNSGFFTKGISYNLNNSSDTYFEPGEKYYYRACVKKDGVHYSASDVEQIIVPDDEEETNNNDYDVETDGVEDRTSTSAQLNGEITGGQNVDEVFFVLKKNNNGSFSCENGYSEYISVSGNANDEGDTFDADVYDLEPDTRYRYRACLREGGDIVAQGNIVSFRTKTGYVAPNDPYVPPVNNGGVDQINTTNILTYGADQITRNTAVINGVYKADSCSSLQTQFQIGVAPNALTTQTSWIERGNTTGVAREELSSLVAGATYYYRFAGICDGKLVRGKWMY